MTPRLVPLTEELLLWAAIEEADPVTAGLAAKTKEGAPPEQFSTSATVTMVRREAPWYS